MGCGIFVPPGEGPGGCCVGEDEIVAGGRPKKMGRGHEGGGEFWAGHLGPEVVLSASEPGIHKGAEVVFEFRVGCQNRENILVPLVQNSMACGKVQYRPLS